jgi:hypothetical protein
MIIRCNRYDPVHAAFWARVGACEDDVPEELVWFTTPFSDEIAVTEERGREIEAWCKSVYGYSVGGYTALTFLWEN